ncbi:MAG: DUF692 domain-containing protein [Proteobacteria bacterium]|jgi:uncharacterized protein (UPF0276 family)|nr:DUF692 domain-containing protein [Pseudomonadota bacterium]
MPDRSHSAATPALPSGAGVGIKAAHYAAALAETRRPAFLEIHAENYLHAGGPAHRYLESLRRDHALSIHGVGLSLGGPSAPAAEDLAARRALLDRYEAHSFSEHLAWSGLPRQYLNDLLPLAYTQESLARVVRHVEATQEALGRRILIENPATYVGFTDSTYSEPDFIGEVVRRSGCGLLLDVNNIVVSAINHEFEAVRYLHELPLQATGEVHLAGHALKTDRAGRPLAIDTHDGPVQDSTWHLFRIALQTTGRVPVLIEWDSQLPEWPALMEQARMAEQAMNDGARETHHAHG